MKKLVFALLVLANCAHAGLSADQADQELGQLTTLYTDNREKFVVQKQEMSQGDCGRATALREAAERRDVKAAMSPENTETFTLVKMELAQAEKDCKAK